MLAGLEGLSSLVEPDVLPKNVAMPAEAVDIDSRAPCGRVGGSDSSSAMECTKKQINAVD